MHLKTNYFFSHSRCYDFETFQNIVNHAVGIKQQTNEYTNGQTNIQTKNMQTNEQANTQTYRILNFLIILRP